jgi:hypothetical protein
VQWQIATYIVEVNGKGRGYVLNRNRHADNFWDRPGIYVLKSHRMTQGEKIKTSNARILMAVRDMRDIICSAMVRNKLTFEEAVKGIGGHVNEQKEWMVFRDRMYLARYEDFVDDLAQEAFNIAKFLKLLLTEQQAQEASRLFSLKRNRKRRPKLKLGNGQVGKYKELLTKEQIDIVENKYKDWLTEYGYSL